MKIHIVQKGDTLWDISQQYNVDFEEVKEVNPQLSSPDMIMPGMKIKIPTSSKPVKKETQYQKESQKETQKEKEIQKTPAEKTPYYDKSPKPMPMIEEDDFEAPNQIHPKMPEQPIVQKEYSNKKEIAEKDFSGNFDYSYMSDNYVMPEYSHMPEHSQMKNYAPSMSYPTMTEPYMPEPLYTQGMTYNPTYYYQPMNFQGKYQTECGYQSFSPQQPYAQPQYYGHYDYSNMTPYMKHYPQDTNYCGCGGGKQPLYQPPIGYQATPVNKPVNYGFETAQYPYQMENFDMGHYGGNPMFYPNMMDSEWYNPSSGMNPGYHNPYMFSEPHYQDTSYQPMYRMDEEESSDELDEL